MSTAGRLPIAEPGPYLNSVIVNQGLGEAHNEIVTLGDPTTPAAMAAVTQRAAPTDYGLVVRPLFAPMQLDTGGRLRTTNLTTLFDGKLGSNVEDVYKWHTVGTGSVATANNSVTLTVTSGQYLVRQGQLYCPYFSGKPQMAEITGSGFQLETGVVKRFGYFSSSAVAPYTASLDGWYIESDGVNSLYRLVCVRNGTETHNIPWTSWDRYDLVSGYDWSKFTVSEVDFLWLGGAGLRLFLVIDGTFRLIHAIDDHAGTQAGLIMQSPQQPVRYEIRGVSAGGSYTTICSQVATEGASEEAGEELAVYNSTVVACAAIGTIYALKGVRKVAGYRTHHIQVMNFGASIVGASSDSGILLLILNPTLSAPLTWAANSRIEEGTAAAGQTITAGTGRVLAAVPMNTSGNVTAAVTAALRTLLIDVTNTAGQVVLAYMPTTATQNLVGQITVAEY